ncbi:MAG: isochorismatase family protein [Candidatus Aenigmarchaeota archaeon]|nr:isochorismatase family protein [Candidatus Aenigmarchaeota archaeon]
MIFTPHVEKDSTTAFAENSENIQLIGALHKKEADKLIVKNKISPFYKTALEQELKGVKHIIVAGILTNLCMRMLIEEAYDRDFQITVITDCCVAKSKQIQDFTFKDLSQKPGK